MKAMTTRAVCLLACAAAVGCVGRGGKGGGGPYAVPTQDVPQVQSVTIVSGAGQYKDGIMMDVAYGRGPSFGALYNTDASVRIEPAENQSGVHLDDGWAYVNGAFHVNSPPAWGFWPIIIRSTMAIGADGTEFIVDCTDPVNPWVHCRKGGPVRVYNTKPATPAEVVRLDAGESAQLGVTVMGTTLIVKKPTDTTDGVYVEAVNTGLEFGLTTFGP